MAVYIRSIAFVGLVIRPRPVDLLVYDLRIEGIAEKVAGSERSVLRFEYEVRSLRSTQESVVVIAQLSGPTRTSYEGRVPIIAEHATAAVVGAGEDSKEGRKKFSLDVTDLPDGWHRVEFSVFAPELGLLQPVLNWTYGVQKGGVLLPPTPTGGGQG